MNILQVSNLYFPSIGGVQNLVRSVSEKLALDGDNVTVFTSNLLGGEQLGRRYYTKDPTREIRRRSEYINGVMVRRYPIDNSLHNLLYRWPEKFIPARIYSKATSVNGYRFLRKQPFCPRVVKEIAKFKADIVVATNAASPFTYYCYLAKKLTRRPYVVVPCLHVGSDWARDPITYKVLQEADGVIALTEFERKHLEEMGVNRGKVYVIGVGIDIPEVAGVEGRLSEGPAARGDFNITFVGRMANGKGIDSLLRAMPLVWKVHPEVHLTLAGAAEPAFKSELLREVGRMAQEESDKIHIIDNFDENEKTRIISGSDVLAVPSAVESFGIVYLEAWSHKKPVIAARNSAPASFIRHGHDGLLVNYGDPPGLSQAILQLIKDPGWRRTMGERGYRKTVTNWSLTRTIDQTRKVYELAAGAL